MKAKHGQVEVLISNEHLQEILWAAPHKFTTTVTTPVNPGPETSLEGEATPEQLVKPDELFPLFIYFSFFFLFCRPRARVCVSLSLTLPPSIPVPCTGIDVTKMLQCSLTLLLDLSF